MMRRTTFSQPEQRRMIPGPCVKASRVPISPSLPQFAHSVGSAVMSTPKISWSTPATAFASSMSSRLISVVSCMSASCGTKTFGADLAGLDPDLHQRIRSGFDHERRSADKDLNGLAQGNGHFPQHVLVNAPRVALPVRRL